MKKSKPGPLKGSKISEQERQHRKEMRKSGRHKKPGPKKAKTKKPSKPPVKMATTKITPHPRIGDEVDKYGPRDKNFEKKLDSLGGKTEPPKQRLSEPTPEAQAELDLKVIADFLKLPFATWASRINFPAIRLTDQEAKEWARPTKVLLDHYMPVIPPIAYAWFAWSVTTISIVNTRIELISAVKRKRGESQTEPKAGTVEAPIQGAPVHKPQKI